jgi:CHRD domain
MRRYRLVAVGVPLMLVLAFGVSAMASGSDGGFSFGARLRGYEETPASINSNGTGMFRATPTSTGFIYTLTFSGLSSNALFAHIHFGQRATSGGVAIFLCGGGGKPSCPAGGGTVTGTISASDVLAIPGQGLTAGDLASVVRAIKAGFAYVNVHSTNFPTGEIRGQIRVQEDGD